MASKTYHIVVSRDHIQNGVSDDCATCSVSLAIRDQTPYFSHVYSRMTGLWTDRLNSCWTWWPNEPLDVEDHR